jgi:hypothetical protein
MSGIITVNLMNWLLFCNMTMAVLVCLTSGVPHRKLWSMQCPNYLISHGELGVHSTGIPEIALFIVCLLMTTQDTITAVQMEPRCAFLGGKTLIDSV